MSNGDKRATRAKSGNGVASDLSLADFQQKPVEEGLSLDQLNAAFAEMLGTGDDPYAPAEEAIAEPGAEIAAEVAALSPPGEKPEDDPCEITPRSILEALLFVGGSGGQPLTSEQVAGLMRGVRPAEVDDLVRDLNGFYAGANCPYQILSDGPGYRLALREEFSRTRDKFLGKARPTQLSPVAIEVLSVVAYNEPVTSDQVTSMRGAPSGHLLTQLVGKQLLKMERVAGQRAAVYATTARFLELFGLKSVDDLPRSEDLDRE